MRSGLSLVFFSILGEDFIDLEIRWRVFPFHIAEGEPDDKVSNRQELSLWLPSGERLPPECVCFM